MNYFSYRKSLRKLSCKRDREEKRLWKLVDEADKTGGYDEADSVLQTEKFYLMVIEDEIAHLKTQYIISKAEKMSLPTPSVTDKDGLWEMGNYTRKWCLTNKGITEMRREIRKERKEILELWSHWATILIGLIGAVTGLIAVIMSKI